MTEHQASIKMVCGSWLILGADASGACGTYKLIMITHRLREAACISTRNIAA